MLVAKQTNTLVSSLFPKEVQRRILEDAANTEKQGLLQSMDLDGFEARENQTNGFKSSMESSKKAIADYFPNATIIFADIVGFTAWSSTRDPTQVFQLLETIYHAFDDVAKKRRVFKVETVGDCYVAASGLPEARADHAVVMARFARDCLSQFTSLVREMEEVLGPDTGDLGLRIGLNSGPVTAGVLRGERSRFQLFGDTVNTAARMESTGLKNMIHLSRDTAELLMAAGKHKWMTPRNETVHAKGKGEMQTYWLSTQSGALRRAEEEAPQAAEHRNSESGSSATEFDEGDTRDGSVINGISDKLQRLVKWNTELLAKCLQIIIAHRIDVGSTTSSLELMRSLEDRSLTDHRVNQLVFDEVEEVINLPPKRHRPENQAPTDPDMVQLSHDVVSELHDYVRTVAAMYRERNPFHNFEHASHVTMSTSKLMARIVAPEEKTGGYALRQQAGAESVGMTEAELFLAMHDNTYGITSDPLTQFAVVFSALIHDVDHPGVPNATLVDQKTALAKNYHNKSVAEQNSIDLGWDLFMGTSFENLRRVLYTNATEFQRFRQIVVNTVMATDIMDKQLGAFRLARWNKAFAKEPTPLTDGNRSVLEEKKYDINRKATIVLEHLIQASDVSHTMQHWHIFIKWNERLFREMYRAYQQGLAEKDPSENWYKGEIGFFDFYVIPLAKKLESCGVFGVSSDEYLAYATNNRSEWESKGEEMVAMYLKNYRESPPESGDDYTLLDHTNVSVSDLLERLKTPPPATPAQADPQMFSERSEDDDGSEAIDTSSNVLQTIANMFNNRPIAPEGHGEGSTSSGGVDSKMFL